MLLNVASANNIKVENDYDIWKKNAPIREVIDHENKIVFLDQELTDYYWRKLLERCVRASILDATEDEIDSFVAAYSILPRLRTH